MGESGRALNKLRDLNATQAEVTGRLIDIRNRLLSMPKDSPPTRDLTRQLAILNKRATELASEVFRADLEYRAAVQAEAETKPASVNTNSTTSLVIVKGDLRLHSFSIETDAGSGTRSVSGELENGGTDIVNDVTLVFDLFNSADQNVGAASDFVATVQAGSRWGFKALILDESPVRAEFKSLDWAMKEKKSKLPQLPGVKPKLTILETTVPAEELNDPALIAQGKVLFQTKICFTCHQTDPAVPAAAGAALKAPVFMGEFWGKEREVHKGIGGPIEKVTFDAAYFVESIRKPMDKVLKGAKAPMPPPPPTTDDELKALLAYVKSLSKK